MGKKNFYAVKKGKKTGVYTSWDECKKYVHGVKGAKFKGFQTRVEANAYIGASPSPRKRARPNSAAPSPSRSRAAVRKTPASPSPRKRARPNSAAPSPSDSRVPVKKTPPRFTGLFTAMNYASPSSRAAVMTASSGSPMSPREVKKCGPNDFQITRHVMPMPALEIDPRLIAVLSTDQKKVYDEVTAGKNVFFTGAAGTGKSYLAQLLIKYFKNKYPGDDNSLAITASTGVAALSINGETFHRTAGVGLGRGKKEDLLTQIKKRATKVSQWREMKVMFLDEISMIDGFLFDKVDFIARQLRQDNRPFGGIQMVVCGDFLQLPLVRVSYAKEPSYFCFKAECWNRCFPVQIQLTRVFRQTDDAFITALHEIRLGKCSSKTLSLLQGASSIASDRKVKKADIPKLFAKHNGVNQINTRRYAALPRAAPEVIYKAHVVGSHFGKLHLLKDSQLSDTLTLKVGARVMLLRNLAVGDKMLYGNGSVGTVVEFVKFQEQSDCLQTHMFKDDRIYDRERQEYHYTPAQSQGELVPLIQFDGDPPDKPQIIIRDRFYLAGAQMTQLPLKLSWAVTIHKSQGMTLENANVNMEQTFEHGQAYTAISRVKSLQGLRLTGFQPKHVMANPEALEYYRHQFPSS